MSGILDVLGQILGGRPGEAVPGGNAPAPGAATAPPATAPVPDGSAVPTGQVLARVRTDKGRQQRPGLLAGVGGNVPGRNMSKWGAFAAGVGQGLQNYGDAEAELRKLLGAEEDRAYQRARQERQDAFQERKWQEWRDTQGRGGRAREVDPIMQRTRINNAIKSDPDIADITKRLEADDSQPEALRIPPEQRQQLEAQRRAKIDEYRNMGQGSDSNPPSNPPSNRSQPPSNPAPNGKVWDPDTGTWTRGPVPPDAPRQPRQPAATPAPPPAPVERRPLPPLGNPAGDNTGIPPSVTDQYPNAKQARDGKWYVPDPARPGKYLMVEE